MLVLGVRGLRGLRGVRGGWDDAFNLLLARAVGCGGRGGGEG